MQRPMVIAASKPLLAGGISDNVIIRSQVFLCVCVSTDQSDIFFHFVLCGVDWSRLQRCVILDYNWLVRGWGWGGAPNRKSHDQ